MQAQCGADEAPTANQLAAHLRQCAKHMFDPGTRRGDLAVTLFLRVRNTFCSGAFALDVYAPASVLQALFAALLG